MEDYDKESWEKLKHLDRNSFGALPLPSPETADMIYALIQKVKELEDRANANVQ